MICKNCGVFVPDNVDKCPSCYMPIIKEEQGNSLVQRNKVSNEIVEEPIVIKQPIIVEKAIIVEQPLEVEQPVIDGNIVEVEDYAEEVITDEVPLKNKKENDRTNKFLLIAGISFGVVLLIGAIIACVMMIKISDMEVNEDKDINVKEEIIYEIEEVEEEEKIEKKDKEVEEVEEGETSDVEEEKNDEVIVGEHLTLQVNEDGKVRSNRFAKGLKLSEDYIIEGYYLPVGVYSINGDGLWNMLRPFGTGNNRKWESVGTIESIDNNLVYMSYNDNEMKKNEEYRVGEIVAKNPTITVELTKETYFTTYGKSATLNIEKIDDYDVPVVKEEIEDEKEKNTELQKEQPIEKLDNSKIICEYIVGLGVIDNDFAREISVSGEMKYGYVIPKGTYRIEGGTKEAYLVLVRNIKYEGKKQNIEYGAIEVSDKNVSYYLYDTKYIASDDDLPLSILQEEGKSVIVEFDNDVFVHPNGRNGQIRFTLVD